MNLRIPTPYATRQLATLALALACGVADPPGDSGTITSETGGNSETGAVTVVPTSATGTDATTATATSSTDTTATTAPLDLPTESFACDPFVQNCPPGEKCTWYDAEGMYWDSTRCVPVVDDPAQVDEDCHAIDGPLSGIDDCGFGMMCWDTDADDIGQCVAFCTGAPDSPHCPESYICAGYQLGFSICLRTCDPLVQDCNNS